VSTNVVRRIVVLGAGYGGIYTFLKLHKRFHADRSVELQLVNKTNYFISTPFLHEVATGSISPEHVAEPIRKIIGCTEEEFMMTEVTGLALSEREVHTLRGPIPYDYLVIALGAQTSYRNVTGAREHTLALKTLEDAVNLKTHFIRTFEYASGIADPEELDRALRFVVVGGGGTGVELVAEMADLFLDTFAKYYDKRLIENVEVMLLHARDELLPSFNRYIRRRSAQVLRRKGITVRLGVQVSEVRPHSLILNTGELVKARTIIWAAGVEPNSLPFDVTLQREKGRILVNQYLQIPSFPEVFVMGDMAAFKNPGSAETLPMLAQVAHRQSVGVARNIIRLVEGKAPLAYTYKHWGDLVSLGEWMAAGELFGLRLFGHMAWFFWRGVYLSKLISWSKKAEVLLDWIVDLFRPRDISVFYEETKDSERDIK